jgi:putative spermidine/putrescine transport system substrate-binding protein
MTVFGKGVVWAPAPDLAKVKAQIASDNVEWDVFDATSSWVPTGVKEGFWEPLDRSIVDTSDLAVPIGEDHAVLFMVASGISWDPVRHPERKHPGDFRELWDVGAFPGRRSFRDRLDFILEPALLADGVLPQRLYPLDVDRGFKALDRIKPAVKVWASATTQLTTLVQTNEVDFAWNWAKRVKAAQEAGISLVFSRRQTIVSREYIAVVKGSRNRIAAMKLLAFALRPDRSAALAERMGFVPTSRKATEMLSPSAQRWAPNLADPNNVLQDDAWWVGRLDDLQQRFREWLLT